MKRIRLIAAIGVGVLVLVSLAASYNQPAPTEVARMYCEKRGIPAANLALLGFRGSTGLFGNRQTVEFQVRGVIPGKKLVVELSQPVYFLGWQVVDFRENLQQQ